MSCYIVHCSCPDADSAARLAADVVGARLAACATALASTSTYRWQGRIEQAGEVLLLIKTSAKALPALQARLTRDHPYELPEILAVEVAAGLPGYLEWVADETRADCGDATSPR